MGIARVCVCHRAHWQPHCQGPGCAPPPPKPSTLNPKPSTLNPNPKTYCVVPYAAAESRGAAEIRGTGQRLYINMNTCVCVCVFVWVCVCVFCECVCACVRACERACVRACVRACMCAMCHAAKRQTINSKPQTLPCRTVGTAVVPAVGVDSGALLQLCRVRAARL